MPQRRSRTKRFLLLLPVMTGAFSPSLPASRRQARTAPLVPPNGRGTSRLAKTSRRGRNIGGGAMTQLHKKVTEKAADRTSKKVVVEELTEEEDEIVEKLKAERSAAPTEAANATATNEEKIQDDTNEAVYGVSYIGGDPCGSKYNDDPFNVNESFKPGLPDSMKDRIAALAAKKMEEQKKLND